MRCVAAAAAVQQPWCACSVPVNTFPNSHPIVPHVTAYLRTSGTFRTGGLLLNQDRSHLRWTLDTPEDLAMFERLFAEAARAGIPDDQLDYPTALELVNRDPSIAALNAHVAQKTT